MIIKTERNAWLRAFDTLLTLLAWLAITILVARTFLDPQPAGETGWLVSLGMPDWNAAGPLGMYLLVALFNGLVLVAWARYNQWRISRQCKRGPYPPVSGSALSDGFGVDGGQRALMQQARRSVVLHDGNGDVSQVRQGA